MEQLQEQLRQAQKLESIGRLAGGVAHDFRNATTRLPSSLTATLGLCWREQLRAQSSPVQAYAAAERSRKAGGSCCRLLTGQLLAFGRKQVIRPRPLDPRFYTVAFWDAERMLSALIGEGIEPRIPCLDPLAHVGDGGPRESYSGDGSASPPTPATHHAQGQAGRELCPLPTSKSTGLRSGFCRDAAPGVTCCRLTPEDTGMGH